MEPDYWGGEGGSRPPGPLVPTPLCLQYKHCKKLDGEMAWEYVATSHQEDKLLQCELRMLVILPMISYLMHKRT